MEPPNVLRLRRRIDSVRHLAAQSEALASLGARSDCIYIDYGLTGGGRGRPGLDEALGACLPGDTLVVTKLHRLAHSIADALRIVERFGSQGVRMNVGGYTHDPADPASKVIFRTLTVLADFEADLIRHRTREGLAAAKADGRLRGKPPKLDPAQRARLVDLLHSGAHSPADLAEIFGVARSTVYRVLERARRGAIAPNHQSH